MTAYGINTGYLLIQCVPVLLWLLLSLFVLFRLREQTLSETAKAIWAVFIVVVPFFGAVAFLIVRPGDRADK